MTILVCGASGLVGRDLCELLERENISYDGTYYACTDSTFCERDNMFRVDFTNPGDVANFFTEHRHKWLVCVFLVVQRMVDVCENDWNAIMRVNVDAVDMMSALCEKNGIYFIHLSTDYVFDGSVPPYFPNSAVNPLQNYGITKLLSEYRVQRNYATSPNYCIIRTPVLYSGNKASPLHDNAVTVLSKGVMDLRTVAMRPEDDYYIRRPVYIPDLCIFIRAIAILATKMKATPTTTGEATTGEAGYDTSTIFSGIYHYYNQDNCYTKYQMTKAISEYLELSHLHIVPVRPDAGGLDCSSTGIYQAKRPYDTQLFDSRYNIRNFFSHSFIETLPHVFSRFKHPKIDITAGRWSPQASFREDNTYFLMFDLDGTLVNTSYAHYRSYLDVFRNRGLPFMLYSEWNKYINYNNIHTYLETVAAELAHQDVIETDRILSDMRNEKIAAFQFYAPLYITQTNHAIDMLRFIQANPTTINAVVVTNSSQATTDIIRQVIPELNLIEKWCVRETYTAPKPHPESYARAVELYYRDEKYIIGFENTSIGYESLRHSTPIIYLYIDEHDEYAKQDKWYYNKDAFYFNDFRCV